MKKLFAGILALLLGNVSAIAQDLITTRKGEDLKVRVTEIGLSDVKYHLWEAPEGDTSSIPKSEILLIRYEDGGKEIFESSVAASPNSEIPSTATNKAGVVSTLSNTGMFMQGQLDAKRYYKGYKDAGAVSFIGGLLLGPVFGLIPAIAITSTTPQATNLDFPTETLMRNRDYAQGYFREAKGIKSRKSWTGYAIGAVIWLAAIAIFISTWTFRLGP